MKLPRFFNIARSLPGLLAQVDRFTSPSPFPASIRCFQSSTSDTARTVAQAVLRDYLHDRSLDFSDAEYISKNSPRFLRKLLSEVGGDKDLGQSLDRFLNYHPINEFEPFLESLGLNPSEYSSFAEHKSLFLGGGGVDKGLFHNLHVLVNYGVGRRQIGKVFTEAVEVFKYPSGELGLKLQAYEKSGLSKAVVIKLVTCCPCFLVGDVDSHFVKFVLKLNGLGVGIDWVGRYLKPKVSYSWRRMLESLDFLEKVGCTEKQLQSLLEVVPALMFEGSGKNVNEVLGLLLKLGLEPNRICSMLIEFPDMLSAKSAKNLKQSISFLIDIGMEAEGCAEIVSKHLELLCSSSLKKRPKRVCRDLKIDKDCLREIIREDPIKLFTLALAAKSNTSVVRRVEPSNTRQEKEAFLIRLGYEENSDEMVVALKKFRGRRDQLQERFDCLVQAGLGTKDVSSMIKRTPMILNQTTEVLEKKIDCLRSYLGYPVDSIATFPAFLCYDVEKISKRLRMYAWLIERGAAKPNLSLSTVLACADKRFVKYFVDVHPDGPAMWESLN